ncbi:MAG: hypothetical protein ACOXZ4_01115 [Sphaerochaetaceae bacterium]|jgi:hypothetical protein
MSKRLIALLLVVVFLCSPLLGAYEPYTRDEFPQWSLQLRRAETIAFGALPLTFAATSLGYNLALSFGAQRFSADPLYDSLATLAVAASAAVIIALADYIITEMQKR